MIGEFKQSDLAYLKDQMQRGLMTAAQANVEKVRMMRVFLVKGRVMADVRSALNAAVKRGELGHIKKSGHKPEVYFHPTFEYLAAGERNAHERSVLRAVAAVCG